MDIHAIEAAPGSLRVAQAVWWWNACMQLLIFLLLVVSLTLAYELVVSYLPSIGTASGVVGNSQGGLAVIVLGLVAAIAVSVTGFNPRRGLGRFMLRGAFAHPRKVRSLAVLRVDSKRTPRVWALRCEAQGRELTVEITARADRLRAALELAGQAVPVQGTEA